MCAYADNSAGCADDQAGSKAQVQASRAVPRQGDSSPLHHPHSETRTPDKNQRQPSCWLCRSDAAADRVRAIAQQSRLRQHHRHPNETRQQHLRSRLDVPA